jgi:hypothetical protein
MRRVLIVYDRAGWAWGHMANGIQRFAPPGFRVDCMPSDELAYRLRENTLASDYDASLQMSWAESTKERLARWNTTLVASHGLEFNWPNDQPEPAARIATRLRNRHQAHRILPRFDSVLCVSERLHQSAWTITKSAVLAIPGVDTSLFIQDVPRLDEPLRVGWCGQRAGVTKGYESRLIPLMDRLDGKVEFVVNDRSADNPLTQDEMVEWHSRIDVFLSTSTSEGCQMPVMEAMASGKPVIATDAGCARLFVRPGWTGSLIEATDDNEVVARLEDEILRMDANPAKRLIMGGNARWLMDQSYSWRVRSPEWLKLICGDA